MRSLTIRQRIRYSSFYDRYALFFQNSYGKTLKNDQFFYTSLFSNKKIDIIFDIGSNDGIKSKTFVKLANNVVAVEPDPIMASILKYRFSDYPKLKVEECALGSSLGEAIFRRKNYPGYSTLSSKWSDLSDDKGITTVDSFKVRVNSIENLIQKHGLPGYVKIDVEGYELNVFKGLKSIIPIVSFEANFPQFKSETIEIIELIDSLNDQVFFNYRIGDDRNLALEKNIKKKELVEIICHDVAMTVDIFVFNNDF